MKIWLVIRRPIGYLLIFAVSYLALGVIHGIPYLLTDWILGL